MNNKYFDELEKSMEWLGRQDNTFFLGQAVIDLGTGMTASFKRVPKEKKIETPVFEECQLGMTIRYGS